MKILEFADLDTSRVKPAYCKVVAAIANGDFRAAQVRKLAGARHGKLYRARLNDADRLIFCLLRHNEGICALMLEVIVNHDYERSRFLRDAVQASALEQGQAYRSKAAAPAKTRVVDPDQAANRGTDTRLGDVQSGYR